MFFVGKWMLRVEKGGRLLEYRKVGLRMCIISIIMIALCIPNQIQIANAAEGDNETDLRIYEIDKKTGNEIEWTNGVTLNLFPEAKENNKWNVQPGSKGDYTFYIENNWKYKASCEIKLVATVRKRDELKTDPDETYPINFQLYKRENDKPVELLDSGGENPLEVPGKEIARTEEIKSGETKEYILSWLFEQVDSTFKGGNYDFSLRVKAIAVTDSDDSKKDDDKKDDTNKGDNNSSTNNGNSGNNSSNNNGNNTSDNNKGNNTTDGSKGNDSSNNNQNSRDNLNIDKTSSKGTGSVETNKKKVNTSDITTPVIYVALMILTFGLILLVKSRKEN